MQIRRKSFLALGGLAASVTMLAACGGESRAGTEEGGGSEGGGASDGGGEEGGAPARADADLVI